MFVSAIVLAAGKGTRFGSSLPKPFVRLAGRPVIEYCLRSFRQEPRIRQFIIAAGADSIAASRAAARNAGIPGAVVVRGGRRRQDSVRNALGAVDPKADIVLIHDSCRPFAGKAITAAVIRGAERTGAAVAAVPVKATIKKAYKGRGRVLVKETPDRTKLWEIQTPQAFRKELILAAHNAAGWRTVTDDASLVELLGRPVEIVPGAYTNIKITTPEDLAIAGALLKKKQVI